MGRPSPKPGQGMRLWPESNPGRADAGYSLNKRRDTPDEGPHSLRISVLSGDIWQSSSDTLLSFRG
jgi:hypothetical protein